MEEQAKNDIRQYRFRTENMMESIRAYAALAAVMTGEEGMTSDYIYGNCTLEQLEAHLDGADRYQLAPRAQKAGIEMNIALSTDNRMSRNQTRFDLVFFKVDGVVMRYTELTPEQQEQANAVHPVTFAARELAKRDKTITNQADTIEQLQKLVSMLAQSNHIVRESNLLSDHYGYEFENCQASLCIQARNSGETK